MANRGNFTILLIGLAVLACNQGFAQQNNQLTPQEKAAGWILLFNGKDLKNWHSYGENDPGKAWQIQEGSIYLNKNKKCVDQDFADLVTNAEYANFDFKVEWKMEPYGNSGVMFYVHEGLQYKQTWETGPEMQIADLYCNGDSRINKCRAGDLYDLIPDDTEWVTEGGKWNQYEIIANHGHLTLIQNGHKIVETQLWTAHWKDLIAHSKFSTMPNFGTFRKGHISFQGTETGKLWFRNIKIRVL